MDGIHEPKSEEPDADRATMAELALKLLREQAQADPKLAEMMRSRGIDPDG